MVIIVETRMLEIDLIKRWIFINLITLHKYIYKCLFLFFGCSKIRKGTFSIYC